MSRVGKNPVELPDKVEAKVSGTKVSVKGPKGQIEKTFGGDVTIKLDGKSLVVSPNSEERKTRALWGTTRAILKNMVKGVSDGFIRELEFNGVGYKAAVAGNTVTLNLGYSHPINFTLPAGVTAKVTKNIIELHGCDKELLGFVASKIRSFREPEPYKGKGVKYLEETIIRKAGKTGAKK
jgi:large subunit ribosomal protein L6